LSGFDRLVFRGTLRQIAFVAGLMGFLWKRRVLLKEFGAWAQTQTKRLIETSREEAERLRRPIVYLPSSRTDKEAEARKIAARDGVTEGLIAVLECVEPFQGFEIYRNRDAKKLQLVPRIRKCKVLYHYFIDPVFGFMNARIQTWLPFNVQICINGREWLARQMDHAGIRYVRRDNCFTRIDDVKRAQDLMDEQLRLSWPSHLQRIARGLNPAHMEIFKGVDFDYYWSVYQSEWATDLMFKNTSSLAEIYPTLVLHGITTFSSADVMRFLGRKVQNRFQGEIVSDFKDRPEGVRIKHRLGANSIKLYDKQGSVLRTETTLNDPRDFKVFRRKEGVTTGPREWLPLRKGIADLHRRARVSQASNDRYLDALSAVDTATPLGTLMAAICRPTHLKDKPVRALRPWDTHDLQLFQAVSRGEFAVNGFRNRDLRALLYDLAPEDQVQKRRRSGHVTRLIRILRAHDLIKKVNATHRYVLTQLGRDLIPAILQTQRVTLQQLQRAVA
jgi:hypothetical protein